MFTKYKNVIMFINTNNTLKIIDYYSNVVATNTTTLSGTIVTPISDGFGNN